jgi:hypothetical protein
MKPENLINWGELSRILSGTRSVVTKNRMPKKYEKVVGELLKSVTTWYNSMQPDKAESVGKIINTDKSTKDD